MKVTTRTIRSLKGKRPIVALTAYDTITATLADQANVDLILVGDSVGTTLLGFESTVPVTLDMILHHTAAVTRASTQALVVADLPFPEGRYEYEQVLKVCAKLMKQGGAEAVKIEGGNEIAPLVSRLTEAGVPVVGHIGLMPQKVFHTGGYQKHGKNKNEKEKILNDAIALQKANVFAIIGEMLMPDLSEELTHALEIPLIGIGSGPQCDGQILVSTDLLGFNIAHPPSFVRTYANLAQIAKEAFTSYATEVQERKFP
jgi:3-methyl-2-oxobutanoate hydroxymethyltransferase